MHLEKTNARTPCHGVSATTYGTRRPLAGLAGGRRIAQRADLRAAARQRAHQQFTQVRAAVRRKTLLLLWWIDDGKMIVVVVHLPGKGSSDYVCVGMLSGRS